MDILVGAEATMTTATKVRKCVCGCGRKAPLARFTNEKRGTVKGKPIRFIPGHEHRIHRVDRTNFHDPAWFMGKR